jgi:hypothetical protein
VANGTNKIHLEHVTVTGYTEKCQHSFVVADSAEQELSDDKIRVFEFECGALVGLGPGWNLYRPAVQFLRSGCKPCFRAPPLSVGGNEHHLID